MELDNITEQVEVIQNWLGKKQPHLTIIIQSDSVRLDETVEFIPKKTADKGRP